MRLSAIFSILLFALAITSAEAQPRRGMTVGPGIQPKDIEDLDKLGANLARYPLQWIGTADNATAEEYDVWLEGMLTSLDEKLPLFEQAGIKVVLNLFTPPGGAQKNPACKSTHRIFCEAWAQEHFMVSWEKIAARYAGNETIIGFDLVNEPGFRVSASGLRDWSSLADETITRIRAIDPTRTVIIGIPFGDIYRLRLVRKSIHSNVWYNTHFYFPWNFQHQGLYKVKLGISYPTKKLNKKVVAKNVKRIKDFQKRMNAPIYIGEFSVVRWAPKKSAVTYLKDLISIFEVYKWNWTYHSFREASPWSIEHDGNIKNPFPAAKETDRSKLLRKYFKKNR